MILALAIFALLLSAIPAALFLANLPLFCCVPAAEQAPSDSSPSELQAASILIPARDEASGIGGCIEAALASAGVAVEVVVLDDDSTDPTAAIVADHAARDPRVRLITGNPLPPGWNGKQHACKQLAEAAQHDRLVFIDADVRLAPDAIGQLIAYQDRTGVGLLSAFPHQLTGTWLETWLIPIMHFVLLGYLPFSRMRSQLDPSLAAGCGQLFLTTRLAYQQAGTHESIKASRHDGVKLPRAYRRSGLMTDVVDGTDLADCRMYRGAAEVVRGVLKNATEGIANPRLILVFTVLLLGCSLLPVIALVFSVVRSDVIATIVSVVALVLAHVPRLVAAKRFRQSWLGAICHIPATITFVTLQWLALAGHLTGRQVTWRGRA